MPEQRQISFSHKEVVIALLKAQDIHEGIWGLNVRFGLGAANMGASDDTMQPTAIVPLLEIGLQKGEKLTNVSVDAAIENPPITGQTPKRIGSGRTTKAGKK